MIRFQRRWQMLLVAKYTFYAMGPALMAFVLSRNWLLALGIFIIIIGLLLAYHKPWKLSLENVSSYVDKEISTAAYSSGLLLKASNLSGLALLQQQRVAEILIGRIGKIRPKIGIFQSILCLITFILLSIGVFYSGTKGVIGSKPNFTPAEEKISFQPLDSTSVKTKPPELESEILTVTYPQYTNKTSFSSSKMNVRALEGSRLQWSLKFDQKVDSVSIEFAGKRFPMKFDNAKHTLSKLLTSPGFYNFRFKDSLGTAYISDLYSVEMLRDQPPVITIEGLQPFISFNYNDKKELNFNAVITDDFGVGNAYIMATVSRGTGESVKFREEQLAFNNAGISGDAQWDLNKRIDMDSLKMKPGDELYFYVETSDLKTPQPNISRSETFFAVIKDTVSYDYAVEGTLGVDRMPDYFRSQRQLIIDTKKLLKNRENLTESEFNRKSNELGAEQSALRLKYGKFMGDENTGEEEHEHEHEGEENPLADYMHDHDGSNEHNLVERDGEQAQKDTSSTGKPDQFTQSLHSKMREALNEMWSSERHLRVNEPRKSLPYQLRALGLLQEIKNSARIYVHRTGFDPPPIKENTRLSGTIEDVDNYSKYEDLKQPETEKYMRKAIALLEDLLTKNNPITPENKSVFSKAGSELAQKSIEQPGKYLRTLQQLKWISEGEHKPKEEVLRTLQSGLMAALKKPHFTPHQGEALQSELNTLFLKELSQND